MKLTKRQRRCLGRLINGQWQEARSCFDEVLALSPMEKRGLVEQRHIGGIGADWTESRITPAGRAALRERE